MSFRIRIDPKELTKRRLEAHLSRQQLGALSGISRRRIDQLETEFGEGVRPETVRAIAMALKCDPSDISEVVEASA